MVRYVKLALLSVKKKLQYLDKFKNNEKIYETCQIYALEVPISSTIFK
jgi:hypothetical protein